MSLLIFCVGYLVQYEGNISTGWCALNGPEETDRFWQAQSDGIYCGHSECFLPNSSTNDIDGTEILWWNFGNVLRGQSYKRIGWFNNYMTNTTIHPRFDQLESKCLATPDGGDTCQVSQLAHESTYYLIHWTALSKNAYNMSVTIDVGNDDEYALSMVDYFNYTIRFEMNVQGPKIEYKAKTTPYDIQLVNTKSIYNIVNYH